MASDDDINEAPASLSALVATLAPTAIVAGIWLLAFLILRRSQRRWYAPRTYIGSLREGQRSPELPSGLFNWFGSFWKIPDVYALQHQSLDAYLFLRFLRMVVIICFVGCCITWPVLFPVNATGGAGQSQLSVLSYSNIDKDTQANRYYAHALILWVYFGFVMYLILRECIYYVNLRQAFLLSPLYANRMSSRTVLFTSVPDAYLDEARLRKVFGDTVKRIWLLSDTSELDDLVKKRDKVAFKLEKAEVKLIKAANKARVKSMGKGAQAQAEPEEPKTGAINHQDTESGTIAARWLAAQKRPSHRLGPLGLLGKKVDTINWGRTELERLIPEVDAAQKKYRVGGYKKIPSVFIEFRTQADAECAAQVLTHHHSLQMGPRFVGITPSEVNWRALAMPWWQRLLRGYAVIAFIAAMIIFWAIPVAVVGAISNVNYLMEHVSFLHFLEKVPKVIMGVITGLLPSVALSILMSMVPIVIRLCARLAGEPSNSRVELFTQNWYFAFQVVQVFLVTTVSSAASAVGAQIANNPSSATTILSQNLPNASNFYISYFIVQGLSVSANVISQVVGFVIFNLLYKYLAGTPRALYNKWASLSALSWGSLLPVYTNIACIALTYAAIAPLVLGFATVGMSLFYFAYRYNVLFVTDTQLDTRGLIYPKALKQLFTGMYLSEVCMIGLFGASVQPGPLVLTVAFLVFTVLFHISLNAALDPLLSNLPMTLLAEEASRGPDVETGLAHSVGPTADAPITAAESNGTHSLEESKSAMKGAPATMAATGKKPNRFVKFLKPWIYNDYESMRGLVPQPFIDFRNGYYDDVDRDAYYPPTARSTAPLLWIPTDPAGISRQEVAHTGKVIPITDEGCELDEKGKLIWDREATRPPLWEEKKVY